MWGDDNDEDLLRAIEESRRMYEEVEVPRLSQQVRVPSPNPIRDASQPAPSTSNAADTFKKPSTSTKVDDEDRELYNGSEAEGFNFNTGKVWVYPTSDKYPVRTYQRNIVEKALFTNTLVSLPTGLGKTFIAAVVMYNYYMWYPKGKIIFMAPTKPLVAQQIENCINILGIPESDTAEMTGALTSKMRAVMWKEKRVFFLTPQCVQNDLTSNICPANAVKCVVIDEAHRALGDHAYAQVIRILNSYEVRFRVLALSATPGSDLEAVQKVLTNLMISHIEMRTEDSADIVQYTHQRNLELMVVDVGPTINRIRVKFIGIATEYAKSLQQQRLLFGNVGSMARFSVLKEWENFRREGTNGMDPARINKANTDFALVHTFVHGLELLQTYGLRLLLNHMKNALNKGDAAANRLSVNDDLKSLIEEIETVLNPIEIDTEEGDATKKRFIYGHPKLDRLQEIVVSHFENFERKGEPTRTIVFCEYREGVMEICDMLRNFEPLVKPVAFMGQSAKTSKGISQKQQLEIMDKFKRGIYNTLISTSVGEEGLDIGEVDLIICFDAKNSPIRQVQRMGRTGRKRQGKIIMLVTRGKEEMKYNQGLCKKRSVGSILLNRENLASHLLEESPCMLPPGIQPIYTERKVIPAPSKPKSNQQDLRKMFQKRIAGSGAGASKSSTAVKPHIGKVTSLSADDFADLKLVWDNIENCCRFDKIPTRKEFWPKSADFVENEQPEPSNIDLATYLEFMRFKQRTHVVGNSTNSLLLTKLLQWADDRRDSDQPGGFSSQMTSTQLWPTKSKKRGRPPTTDAKPTNPPKKRGRPKKASSNSPAKPKDTAPPENLFFPPNKPKSRPQFIDDDDESSPSAGQDPPQIQAPSTSVFLAPLPPLPIPSKSGGTSIKSDIGDRSSISIVDEIIIESDEDDDLNSSSVSRFGYMSSQANQQDLFSELSRALKTQAPLEDEDDCIVCDALFSCNSLNDFVLQKKPKDDITWKNVKKTLEEALKLVPQLTKDALSKYNKPSSQSQRFVSLLPKYEFADDEMFDGMLCGGVGDLSTRRSLSPAMQHNSQTSFEADQRETNMEVAEGENLKMEIDHVSSKIISASNVACSTPRKEQLNEEEDPFGQDDRFNFLGLSKLDDIFVSQNYQKNDSLKTPSITYSDFKAPSPLKVSQSSIKSESQFEMDNIVHPANLMLPKFSPAIPKEFYKKECITPPKQDLVVSEQVSPILGSQATKKPRLGLRTRKRSSTSLNQSLSAKDHNIDVHWSERDASCKGNGKHDLVCSDEVVTSSSQITTSPNCFKPPEVNFDLCDDDFFKLSGEDCSKKSEIADSLKEVIRQKALEAKARPAEITFTQEMKNLCETSIGGLTQLMDMFETKEKSAHVQIERADSSCSPRLLARSTSPLVIEDGSEEDLFADCDGDSFLCRIDSTEFTSPKQTSPPDANEGLQSPPTFKQTNQTLKDIQENDNAKILFNGNSLIKEEAVPFNDRSLSPVLMQTQNTRRPSKLSLKKKKSEVLKTVSEHQEAKPVSLQVDTPIEKCQSEVNINCKEKKQYDLNSQIDFSKFGDEFNNSWLLSQEKEKENTETNEVPSKCQNENSYFSTTKSVIYTEKEVDVKSVEHLQATRSARDSSPENELDVAFAKLDAARKEQKKSVEQSILSPIKSAGTSWLFSTNQPSSSKVQSSISKPSRLKKLSRASNLSSVSKINQLFSSPTPAKSGWLTTNKSQGTKNGKTTNDDSSAKNTLNLSDFCDNSLLDVFGSQKSTTEEPKVSSIEPFHDHSKVKDDDCVIVLSSSDDENVMVSNNKRKNGLLNLTSSSEEGLLPKQVASVDNRKSIDSPLTKKRSRDAPRTSSSSDSFVQKSKCIKMQKTEGLPADTSDINNSLELSNFCDESLLNDILDDSHAVANVKKGAQARRQKDFISSSDEDDFVRKDSKPTKTKKETKKRKKSKKANCFIMSEAEESDDGARNSSDGESTSLDELDSSFINDSQPEASQADIQAKYLQSVKSPATGMGRFKIPNRLPDMVMDNVYSQYPDADELNQTYTDDSFCVDNEPTQYEPEMSLLEIAEARLKAERKEKRKLKKALRNGLSPPKRARAMESDNSEEEVQVKKKRLKRIRVLEETMYEKEGIPVESLPAKLDNNTVPKSAANTSCDAKNSEVNESGYTDLALLLDDDLDFSAIPDPTPVSMKPPQGQPSNSKFDKKTPVLQSDGSTVKMNLQNGWKMPGNSCYFPQNLPSTLRQAANTNVAASLSKSSHNASGIAQKPNSSVSVASTASKEITAVTLKKVFIIASSRQIAASPDLLRVLRVNYQVTIIPHSVPDADFIISWRLGVSRIFSSDLRDKKKLEELVKKLKLSYGKPHLIVENDRIKSLASSGFQKKGKKAKAPATVEQAPQTQSPWSANIGCGNAALLRQAGVQLLFSQNFDETARFLAKLGMKETKAGCGIPEIAHNLSDEMESRLEFFCSLPCINYAFALKLLQNFPTLSEFVSRCSTVLKISSNLGVDINAAKRIFSVICEAHV